ncbi:hypothetical protein CYY_000584 [Polysphondylium violaceum]|uniref:NAD+ kinase family protein n=1 Tax=Polysphondylium violaceum TaxID=133409 RepID=A0A8J4Q196_9MYCE|nr:hypothetical protein CYY_000584 [Polysphondylium violaceum]
MIKNIIFNRYTCNRAISNYSSWLLINNNSNSSRGHINFENNIFNPSNNRSISSSSSNTNNSQSNNNIDSRLITPLQLLSNKVEYKIVRETNNPNSSQQQEGSRTRFKWIQKPKTVLIIKKHKDKKTTTFLNTIASFLNKEYGMKVLVEPNAINGTDPSCVETYSEVDGHLLGKVVDFVITLGGDGTLLHVSSLFKEEVPPVISFHMGTLGFLMPFSIDEFKESLSNVIKGDFLCTNRMRLTCDVVSEQPKLINNNNSNNNNNHSNIDQSQQLITKTFQVLNEVTLHRGSNPHLTTIKCTVNGHNLSDFIGDGLIIATATGSTAYSLSCGGPMVHPCINCILLTPIASSSFSSKPALLPDDSVLKLNMISQKGRTISATFDGTRSVKIEQGDYLVIRKSTHPFLTINKINETTDWVHGNGKLVEMSEKSSIWNQSVYTTSAN